LYDELCVDILIDQEAKKRKGKKEMIVGDFELFTDNIDNVKTATVRKCHECFALNVEDIYHLEFVIKEIKRQLNLK
jgi:hypothetical protein